jgi:hypothetical protein
MARPTPYNCHVNRLHPQSVENAHRMVQPAPSCSPPQRRTVEEFAFLTLCAIFGFFLGRLAYLIRTSRR